MQARRQLAPLADVEIERLRVELRGEVIGPHDPGYADARGVFFSGFDRRPALIVRVADSADVGRVVALARETGLELAVRSGGHSSAGHGTSEGGIVLDLSRMRGLELDVDGHTAWAETGLTAGEYTNAAAAHGLATPFGDTASVGIGGITLAGGLGFLVRKHGLTIDNLLAAEVVTADGRLVKTDADTEPDLFWAIRGGGGNFGVATRFRYRLVVAGEILGGMMILPATPEVIAGFVAAADDAPEELSTIAAVMLAPPMPFIPAEHHGQPIVMVQLVHAAGGEAAERAVGPFRALAEPLADTVRPMRYPEMFAAEGPKPLRTVMRNMFLDGIEADAAETILERLGAATAPMAAAQLRVLGGAVDRVPAGATAYAHRGRRIMVTVSAMFTQAEERPQHEAWASDLAAEFRDSGLGAYTGFMGDEGPDRVREAYPQAAWNRLARIKAEYDPQNLFRRNQNVPPAEGMAAAA
jgi:FAD/FMN-containing dehydrogenase